MYMKPHCLLNTPAASSRPRFPAPLAAYLKGRCLAEGQTGSYKAHASLQPLQLQWDSIVLPPPQLQLKLKRFLRFWGMGKTSIEAQGKDDNHSTLGNGNVQILGKQPYLYAHSI